MMQPCETYQRAGYKFCPDCGVQMGPEACPLKESDFWRQVEDEALTLGAMLEAYGEVSGAAMLTCPACGYANESEAMFCGACGAGLQGGGAAAPAAAPVAAAGAAPAASGALTCPSCGADNEPGAAFCETCGAGLAGVSAPAAAAPVCAACGAGNEPGAAFCETCGASLTGQAPAAAAPAGRNVTCNACGAENQPGAAFCETCGATLGAAAQAQASLPAAVVALPDPNAEVSFDLGSSEAPMEEFNFDEPSAVPGGMSMGASCGVCGHENPEGAGFCEMCGSQLN